MKFSTLSFLVLTLSLSTAFSATDEFVGPQQEGGPVLRVYICDVSMMQRLKLNTGESFDTVVDKKTCAVDAEVSVEDSFYSLIQSEKTAKLYDNIYGLMISSGAKANKQLYYMNEEQQVSLKKSLMWARENSRDISFYYIKQQTAITQRGFPDTMYMRSLQNAEFKVEAAK